VTDGGAGAAGEAGASALLAPGRRALLLAYDGEAYSGWQVQPDRPTVQGRLQEALGELFGEPVLVQGASRTDAGVHALGQVAHFDDPRGLPPERLAAALNRRLPPDVRVRGAAVVAPDFHARHAARRKTYVYQLHLAGRAGLMPPHRRRSFHAVRAELDLAAMRAAAVQLVGVHDFTAVSRTMEPGRPTVRELAALRVLRIPQGLRVVAVGDGFLYGMVRMLAGLLVDVGRGRRAPASVAALLAARDRSRSPPSLPPQGLFLVRVRYATSGQDEPAFRLLS